MCCRSGIPTIAVLPPAGCDCGRYMVQPEHLALAQRGAGKGGHLLGEQRVGPLVLALIPQPPDQQLLIAAAFILVFLLGGIGDGKLGVVQRVAAPEQGSGLRALVIEFAEVAAFQAGRHRGVGGRRQFGDGRRVGLLLIENGADVGDRSRRSDQARRSIARDLGGTRRSGLFHHDRRDLRRNRCHGAFDAGLNDRPGLVEAGFVRSAALLASHIGRLAGGGAAFFDRLRDFQCGRRRCRQGKSCRHAEREKSRIRSDVFHRDTPRNRVFPISGAIATEFGLFKALC